MVGKGLNSEEVQVGLVCVKGRIEEFSDGIQLEKKEMNLDSEEERLETE